MGSTSQVLSNIKANTVESYARKAIELKFITAAEHTTIISALQGEVLGKHREELQEHLDAHHQEKTKCKELADMCDLFIITRELGTGRWIVEDVKEKIIDALE